MSDFETTTAAPAAANSTNLSGSAHAAAPGLTFSRHFTKPGVNPFDEVTWELRDAIIQDFKGKLVFEQKNVEVPSDWSVTATNIVASKYLHGQVGTPEREKDVYKRQVQHRAECKAGARPHRHRCSPSHPPHRPARSAQPCTGRPVGPRRER